jgi:hypothetical protein
MPSLEHESYRKSVLKWFRKHGHKPDVAAGLELYKDAALVLWHLDLGPALPLLRSCYAPSARGGDPWPPLLLLRSLLLSALVGQPRINSWVPLLKSSRVLRVLSGLPAEGDCAGVGTFYDFLNRLHDGPIRRECEHQARPSKAERLRARAPRAPKPKPEQPERPGKRRAKKSERSRRRRHKDPVKSEPAELGVTEKLIAELRAARELPNPRDLLARLSALLLEVAVLESARRGLLGDLGKLVVSGDSSVLETFANGNGRRTCEHGRFERCDCPRTYADPDAAWGYDSYRECFFFGYKFYELDVSGSGHDLPLFVALNPANESDFTALPQATERLLKLWRERELPWSIWAMPLDAGHDGEPIYRFLLEHGIRPVIPLKQDAPAVHPQRPELHLSPRGIPQCEAGAEMASWGSAGADRKVFICPVKAGSIAQCPIAPESEPQWLCRPEAAWAPTVTLSVPQNPRLCPPIPRNSATFKELYNLRSGSERSNSVKKAPFALEAAHHRRASFWLIRLHLLAVLQHVRAWVAEDGLSANALVEHLLGRNCQAKAS